MLWNVETNLTNGAQRAMEKSELRVTLRDRKDPTLTRQQTKIKKKDILEIYKKKSDMYRTRGYTSKEVTDRGT